MQTTIAKWGNSHGVRLSRVLMDEAGFSDGEYVDVKAENGGIVIRKRASRPTLDELFSGYADGYRPGEADWGLPVGGEEW